MDFIFKLKTGGGDDTETQAFSLKSIMFSVEVNPIFIAKKSVFTKIVSLIEPQLV